MKKRIVIFADRKFDSISSKLAHIAIRYLNKQIVAIIDSSKSGRVIQDVLGYGGDIPIYSSLDEALQYDPNTLLIGISTQGGKIPSEWYPLIIKAIQNKLNIISGLQEFIQDVAEFRVLAEKYNVKITDLQNYHHPKATALGIARNFRSKIILTVGTHTNVGKMVTTIELVKEMQKISKSADWLATATALTWDLVPFLSQITSRLSPTEKDIANFFIPCYHSKNKNFIIGDNNCNITYPFVNCFIFSYSLSSRIIFLSFFI